MRGEIAGASTTVAVVANAVRPKFLSGGEGIGSCCFHALITI
jgi:hypothetical protein